MGDSVLVRPEPDALNNCFLSQARTLRAKDGPPRTRAEWDGRRVRLREAMVRAMGQDSEPACPLDAKVVGELHYPDYRVENLILRTRPGVSMTANAYVPTGAKGKVPGVLAVHGHWAGARRDPVVQARCLGLVKLGFFVLAVDAFGAGERSTKPGKGAYHGALYGAALWPSGYTLLGMQVHDNRRAVDYLRSRPEVDCDRLGVTGASGGGNQSMYAGALDERFRAVVPVCSVGSYQAYLQAACCVCEVLPGALRFTEEGDVLGLVAPRALMVITASRDSFQFSKGEAEKSLSRSRSIYDLYDGSAKLRHVIFESGHDYSRPMREAMYGWMMRWLKDEGSGDPLAEPRFSIEDPEKLSCFPKAQRPKEFLSPPSFAAREGRKLVERNTSSVADHAEEWESSAVYLRTQLRDEIFGGFAPIPETPAKIGKTEIQDRVETTPVVLFPESNMPAPAFLRTKGTSTNGRPTCLLLHMDGKASALKHEVAANLLDYGWTVAASDLRGTGETRPQRDAIADAPDHNSAEHAVWIGRPLLGQWVFDVLCWVNWLALRPAVDRKRISVVGLDQAGVVALAAAGLLEDQIASTGTWSAPVTYITDEAYGPGFHMGLLAPGILRCADIVQMAALAAPRKVTIAGGVTPQGAMVKGKELARRFEFARKIFKLYGPEAKFTLMEEPQCPAFVMSL